MIYRMAREKTQKRNRFETMYIILKLCSGGSKKTHIMYRANLSHQQLEKYLSILFDKQLLEMKDASYATTQRGYLFIRKFDDLVNFMNDEESPYIMDSDHIEQGRALYRHPSP